MGLTSRTSPARTRLAVLLLTVASAVGCVKELELPTATQSTTFVDGAVLVGSPIQELRFGFTVGLAEEARPIRGAEITVVNLATGDRHRYSNIGGVDYEANYTPRHGDAYQLEIRLPDVAGPYRSRADSLPYVPFSLSAELALKSRLNRDGVAVPQGSITARTTVRQEGSAPLAGALTVRQSFVWAYADRICTFLDLSRLCYFVDDNEDAPPSLIDLSTVGGSGAATFDVGSEAIDYRMAEQAYFVLRSRRYSAAAAPFLTTYQIAQAPSGTPFDERLLPGIGNIEGPPEAPGVLGFFGVAEAQLTVLPVRAVAGSVLGFITPLCSLDNAAGRFDCCECANTEGALVRRPSYLP